MTTVGADLVLVHGWASHPGVFAPVEPMLAKRYRLHRVSLPGYAGDDPRDGGTLDRLAAYLRRTTPAGATWLAWSSGALAALRLAADHAGHVRALNLVAPVVRFERGEQWPHGAPAGVLDSFRRALAEQPGRLLQRFARMVLFPATDRALARDYCRDVEAAGVPTAALDAGLDLLADGDVRHRLGEVAVPVTVFHGERDAVVDVNASRDAVANLPDARLCLLTGAGHAPFLTDPQAFGTCFDSHGRH